MKSKDQILLEQIYGNLLKEQEDEHLESDYESRSDVDFQDDENISDDPYADDKEYDRQKDEDEEEETSQEEQTPLQKQADALLDPEAPEGGVDDQELDMILKLIEND